MRSMLREAFNLGLTASGVAVRQQGVQGVSPLIGAADAHPPARPRHGLWDDDVRIGLRARLIVRDGRRCHYCARPLGSQRSMGTIDHLWPRSLGRVDRLWNLVLACGSCNSKRGSSLDWCTCDRCRRARLFAPLILRLTLPRRWSQA